MKVMNTYNLYLQIKGRAMASEIILIIGLISTLEYYIFFNDDNNSIEVHKQTPNDDFDKQKVGNKIVFSSRFISLSLFELTNNLH